MSFKITNLNKPTPEKWQKIGKALTRSSIFISGSALVMNYPSFALTILVLGGVGEFITNFYADD